LGEELLCTGADFADTDVAHSGADSMGWEGSKAEGGGGVWG
jgi:hypothetical protein